MNISEILLWRFTVLLLYILPGLKYNNSRFDKLQGEQVDLQFKWGAIVKCKWCGNFSFLYSVPHESEKGMDEDMAQWTLDILGWSLTVRTNPFFYSNGENCGESRWTGFIFHPFADDSTVTFYLNGKGHYFYMPWFLEHVRHTKFTEPKEYPFYDRHNRCDITATVTLEEREWRWRWFTLLPYPRMIKRTLDVWFSEEYGPRKGGWKGGTLGCSFDIKKGETIEECIARYEKEYR